MKNLTYRELAVKIAKMDEQELDQNVSVYVRDFDEYYPVESIKAEGDLDGVLDEGSIVMFTPLCSILKG